MKRFLSVALFLLLVLALPLSAFAVDETRQYQFSLEAGQEHSVQATPGEVLTVTLRLQRTDSPDAAPIYSVQDELQYDPAFFRVIEDSLLLSDGVESTDLAMRDGNQRLYLNYLSLDGGSDWSADTVLGTFQVEVLAESGTSTITNEDCIVSTEDGSDTFAVTTDDLTVVVSTECTVHFESNGGSAVPDQAAVYGDLLTEPDVPHREGKAFAGWYKDIDLTQAWDFATDTVPGNMTLYAKWEDAEATPESAAPTAPSGPSLLMAALIVLLALVLVLLVALLALLFGKRYTIRFHSNGGTPVKAQKVRKNGLVTQPPVPQKAGSTFAGWYLDSACTQPWHFQTNRVTGNTNLYAKWV